MAGQRTFRAWISVNCVLLGLVLLSRNLDLVEAQSEGRRSKCYDDSGRAQRCVPEFENAAFKRPVESTNTCGENGVTEFCRQTRVTGGDWYCFSCDARDPRKAHPVSYLTDFNNNDDMTWWQSETMYENVQHPNMVNLTLKLGKAFEVTYVRLKFHSPRPESFVIYKRTSMDGEWIPYQYYSGSCEATYRKRRRDIITRADETKAICTDEYSDISPLTGGNVAFSTLEGRPSAYEFDTSSILQEWVTATDIRITLNRLNTFGDEVFGDKRVLQSYYYAISDFAVGGRCKCNGHASKCEMSTGQGLEQVPICLCEHNTAGPDCNECKPGFHARPWGRANERDAMECQACNCNGLSNRCYFDADLYQRTGDGGHCLDCQDNTAGPHCERCKENFYQRAADNRCEACNCNEIGSQNLQCAVDGRCRCKPGVTGDKCDRCARNFYDFSNFGCRACQCLEAGSLNNIPQCSSDTGVCTCKEYVEGQNCDRCKPGYFNLQASNDLGCIACFCYGHSSVCTSSPQHVLTSLESDFENDGGLWKADDRDGNPVTLKYDIIQEDIGLQANGTEFLYFVAPSKYLGDQSSSYGRFLSFGLRIGSEGARTSRYDVVLEGNGRSISIPIFGQGNSLPRIVQQTYKFRLQEHPTYQWTPQLSALEFKGLLANLTAIKIRGTYTDGGVGFLDNVKLETASRGVATGDQAATWVEQCQCPAGYVGQVCESCAPGYHRDPPNGGPYARCIPCNCNGHSDTCDVNTGRCICQHNTAGDNCERCAEGYYGYALAGTANDCKPCPCPDGGSCVELLNGDVACINCREGYAGNRCEYCADGYYGDPNGTPRTPCQRCQCNDNVDFNAVANCNSTTGECMKCIYNTGGFNCDRCLPGFYGDALALPKGQCKACNCYRSGSVDDGSPTLMCDSVTGQCDCQPNVVGLRCDRCYDGYWNIDSGTGCESCFCDRTGALNITCDIRNGQCDCKPGVGGRTCNECQPYHFGFSVDGCSRCDCDRFGSTSQQCNVYSGECPCKPSVEGRKCDRCMENKYNITAGCIDCPPCYNLVRDGVNIHRRKLNELREMINNLGSPNNTVVDDKDFQKRLSDVNISVNSLLNDAKHAVGEGSPVGKELSILRQAVNELMMQGQTIRDNINNANISATASKSDIRDANDVIDRAETALSDAELYLQNQGQKALTQAKEALEKVGQQSEQLTNISREARQLSESQQTEAAEIEETANQALNISNEADKLARETMKQPALIEDEIKSLENDVTDTSDLYNKTKELAEQAEQLAKDAYNEALGIFSEAQGIMLPTTNVPELKANATQLKEEAAQVQEEADNLLKDNEQLMQDVEQQKAEANNTLMDARRQQQIADELMADADAARAMAKEAVSKAEKILQDAKETLETLKRFDELVQKSKGEAEEAMKQVPEIQALIDEAKEKTKQANEALSGAEQNATLAQKLAIEAKDISEMAAKEAQAILEEAEKTKKQATDARDRADALEKDLNAAEEKLLNFDKQADTDKNLTEQALQKADQAKASATDSSSKVAQALKDVNDILRQLGTLEMIDTTVLDTLEANLARAEKELEDSDLDKRFNDLSEARNQQRKWVDRYTNDLIQLRRDVDNIEQIKDSLPDGCFKRPKLETIEPAGKR